MVSKYFRRIDKYTDRQMMKINPMLKAAQKSTEIPSGITTPPIPAIGGGTNDEEISSAAISDQVTMASPFGEHVSQMQISESDPKSTKKREIQIGLMNAIQNIRDLPIQQTPKQGDSIKTVFAHQV